VLNSVVYKADQKGCSKHPDCLICPEPECLLEGSMSNIAPSNNKPTAILTNREKEILIITSRGHNAQESARLLKISKQTIKNHLKNIHNKLDCPNTLSSLVKVLKLGIIKLEEI
jgi:DNA-binding CsgD family transcriptional regulator